MPKRQLPTNPTLFDCMTKQEKAKNYSLKRRYGITLLDYRAMLKKQKGKCAICDKLDSDCKRGLVVDHNHRTGHVRGLLCNYCNTNVVGRHGDDYRRMQGFILYLQKQFKEDKKWGNEPDPEYKKTQRKKKRKKKK